LFPHESTLIPESTWKELITRSGPTRGVGVCNPKRVWLECPMEKTRPKTNRRNLGGKPENEVTPARKKMVVKRKKKLSERPPKTHGKKTQRKKKEKRIMV